MQQALPITHETLEKMVSQWAKICQYHESGSIYIPSKSEFLWRYHYLLDDKKLYKKYFGKEMINLIDAEGLALEDEIDWEKAFKKFSHNKFTIFFIIGIDRILLEKNNSVLAFLEKKATAGRLASFLLFFNFDFTHPNFWPLLANKSALVRKIIFHPLYSNKDIRQFILWHYHDWKMKINKEQEQAIINQCGGRLWLVKEALRFIRDNPRAKEKEIFSHEQMKWRLRTIWDKYLESEKVVILKVIKKQKNFTSEEKYSLQFLKATGQIRKNKKNWELTISLLEEFIKENLLKTNLVLDKKGRILFNNQLIDIFLTRKERKIIKALLENKGKILVRDKLAEYIWGEKWSEFYSDWAIDQLIRRVRHKLVKLDISPKILKTVRNQGYLLSSD